MHKELDFEQFKEPYTVDEGVWRKGRNLLLVLGVVGWTASGYGWATNSYDFYASYLVNYMFFLTIGWGALFFVAIQHITSAGWSVTVRRIMENLMITLPVMALLFLPVAIGVPDLYEWGQPGFFDTVSNPGLRFKAEFFSPTWYVMRTVIYFAVWIILSTALYKNSVAQDTGLNLEARANLRWWSAPGVLALMITATMASVDWVMSLDPHWYSTMFGVYLVSGGALAFMSMVTLICLMLHRAGMLTKSITREHFHDLGKWMFALTIWWGYIAFSQYMLIWYADLPEETIYFKVRMEDSWAYLSALLVVGQFIVPFLLLLTRAAKRNYVVLAIAATWILLIHGMDIHWLVFPSVLRENFHLQWLDVTTFLAVGSVFAFAFWRHVRINPMIPVGDLRLGEALTHHNM